MVRVSNTPGWPPRTREAVAALGEARDGEPTASFVFSSKSAACQSTEPASPRDGLCVLWGVRGV